MVIKVGEKIPSSNFKVLKGETPITISSEELFSNKKTVLFSVPGAFTPKSTNDQVPSYLKKADEIFSLGIEKIYCVSVNDSFVMDAWSKHCKVNGKILMLADGHCEFFTSIGLEMDCTRFTLGYRCERFSMIIDDDVVKSLNVEEPGGPVDISSAKVIVEQLKNENSRK